MTVTVDQVLDLGNGQHAVLVEDQLPPGAMVEFQTLCHANHLTEPDEPLCDSNGYVSAGRWTVTEAVEQEDGKYLILVEATS